jgi:hypothetical protein
LLFAYSALSSLLQIHQLFVKWNKALKTGVPENVVDLYAANSSLLATLDNKVLRKSCPATLLGMQ